MNTSALETITNLSDGGYYLPALAFGLLYVYSMDQNQVSILVFEPSSVSFLIMTFVLLVSGSIMHSVEESISGPQSERSPTSFQTGVQRSLHVIYQQGKPSEYPKTWSDISDIEYDLPKKRAGLAIGVLFLYILLVISYPITVIGLFDILSDEKYLAGGLIFIELSFVLQSINQILWPNSYLEEEKVAKVGIVDTINEFRTFIDYKEGINIEDLDIEMARGGEVQIEYRINTDSRDAILESIVAVSYAFGGSFLKSSYPCKRLVAIIREDGEDVGTFTIKKAWVEKLESGKITHSEFMDSVVSTLVATKDS